MMHLKHKGIRLKNSEELVFLSHLASTLSRGSMCGRHEY